MEKHYPREECGVFGIHGINEASKLAYLGLYALQHRGQESAGIVAGDGNILRAHRAMGLVVDIFKPTNLERLSGKTAIGHVRYSTSGKSTLRNAQPLHTDSKFGAIAIAHNGNLVNALALRETLEAEGSLFSTTSDSEVILHLLAKSVAGSIDGAITDALQDVQGAYSIVMLTPEALYAARDPQGFRPLALGKVKRSRTLDKQEGYVVASETCAFDIIDAEYIRDIEPGEMVKITKSGIKSIRIFPKQRESMCVFEYVYFSKPDSLIYGKQVYEIRKQLGVQMAREFPIEADIVVPVPDSSNIAAMGYAEESGIPFQMGLIRNHYIGRTFIEPSQSIRGFGAKIKYNPVRQILDGKRVVVVDDSIVRGTTSRKIMKMLRKAGAKELHFLISCPPWKFPCFYGIDTPTRSELIGATHSIEEIQKHLRVDSLGYLSQKGMLKAAQDAGVRYCTACFDGNYPVKFDVDFNREGAEKLNDIEIIEDTTLPLFSEGDR
jgi:amidophosphoribosyltransferase